jgi:hypothetical protein
VGTILPGQVASWVKFTKRAGEDGAGAQSMALIKRSELGTNEAPGLRDLLEKTALVELLADNLAGKVNNTEFDVFLCHAFLDALEAKKIREWLEGEGLTTYVDRMDEAELSRELASAGKSDFLKERVRNCKALVFVTSESWTRSVWMPWELGYFDALGLKIAILPIHEGDLDKSEFHGQEYLGIYPYIDRAHAEDGTEVCFWIKHKDASTPPKRLKAWLDS